MTQTSAPWPGTATGDATDAPYDADEWSDLWRKLHLDNRASNGIIRGYLNELAATVVGDVSPVSVNSGGAFVDGTFYESDAVEIFTLANPAANPRIDRIVLRKGTIAQTVRLVVITGAEGVTPSPWPLTQTNNVTWDIPLWQVYIDTAGKITLHEDYNWAFSPLGFDVGLSQGRLSLLWDNSVPINDQNATAPNSTNAGADTVTFAAAEDWNTGQAVQISATTNGLTINTLYYVATADNLTYSFHTSLHDALLGQNLVDLTGNIEPSTLFSAAIYLTRHKGDSVDVLHSTYGWTRLRIPNRGIMLDITDDAAFTANDNFDAYITEDGNLEELVWTNDTLRATDIDKSDNNDGVYLQSGDQTRRYLGTFRTTATAGQVFDIGGNIDGEGGQRFVWNYHNQVDYKDLSYDSTDTWVVNNAVYAALNGGNANWKAEFVIGVQEYPMESVLRLLGSGNTRLYTATIALDGIVFDNTQATTGLATGSAAFIDENIGAIFSAYTGIGYHYLQAIERNNAGGNSTIWGDNGDAARYQSGMITIGKR